MPHVYFGVDCTTLGFGENSFKKLLLAEFRLWPCASLLLLCVAPCLKGAVSRMFSPAEGSLSLQNTTHLHSTCAS